MFKFTPKLNQETRDIIENKEKLKELANCYGSPLNILFPNVMDKNISNFKETLKEHHLSGKIYYAHKCNKSNSFLKQALQNQINVDVASLEELKSALSNGFTGDRIEATGPKNDDFIDITRDIEKHYIDTIEILRQTVEAKDPYTRGHSDRVSAYSVLLGKKLALPKKDLITLKIGGLFHDIGKIGIPDSILLKESKLTDEEYSQIKMHPIVGVQILGNSDFFYDCLPIILHHHEKFDGSGYPNRLRGHDIPYLARICTIVDAFDAMTSRRSYRDVIPLEKVVDELKKYSGTQFDPRNFVCFLRYC